MFQESVMTITGCQAASPILQRPAAPCKPLTDRELEEHLDHSTIAIPPRSAMSWLVQSDARISREMREIA